VGIAAAARYLGYTTPDSFRRARTRHPIPGYTKPDDGRPCWTPGTCKAGNPTENRRVAVRQQAAGLAAFRVGHGQQGEQVIQLGLFELVAIGAVLGGNPQ
jgi:hypothetical protein